MPVSLTRKSWYITGTWSLVNCTSRSCQLPIIRSTALIVVTKLHLVSKVMVLRGTEELAST